MKCEECGIKKEKLTKIFDNGRYIMMCKLCANKFLGE